MTCGQSNAARRKARQDERYQYRTTIETSQRRLAKTIEKDKLMRARKSKKG